MVELIGILFGVDIPGDPGNIVLDGGPDSPVGRWRGSYRGKFCPLCCAKMVEWIEVLFGVDTLGGPRNTLLDVCPDVMVMGV